MSDMGAGNFCFYNLNLLEMFPLVSWEIVVLGFRKSLMQLSEIRFGTQPNIYDGFFFCENSYYSQICSNDHLYKTTTRLRRPMLSPPRQIPIQLLLYNTTTRLTRPMTTFFVSQMKKNLFKTTTTKLYPAK